MIVLPAVTSEKLEVELTSWAAGVTDPTALPWKSLVSGTYNNESRAPGAGEPWVSTTCALVSGRYFVSIPVDSLTPGYYGVWARVAGSALGSPARWCGQIRII